MATKRARGAIRASRRRTLKRLVVHPPKTRKAMLGASALVGGALGNLAAFVARPRPVAKWARRGAALAAGMVGSALLLPVAAWAAPDGCTAANTYTWTCKGTVSAPGGPYAPSGSDYSFTFKGNGGSPPHPYVLTSSTTFQINSPGLSGELDFNSGSSITNLVGNALVINSTVGNEVSSVKVIMDGQLHAGSDGSDHSADGLRIVGGSINAVTIKVGKNDSSAVIEGSDDGIFINPDNITGEDAKVTITNYGTIAGMGMSGNASNASEGIHISGGGTSENPNGYAGGGYQVDAAVEIDNYGTISGQLEHDAESFNTENPGGLGGGGQGISVSANNKINIENYAEATITGSEGVFAYGNDKHNIILTNYGHIEGMNGDGADLSHANDISVENHSLGSMIGTTNGQEISYANTTTYDNSGGLTAGLGGDGLLIHNIDGATSDIPEYAVTVLNTVEDGGSAGGIIVGSTSGISMYGIDLGVSYVSGQNGVLVDNSGSNGSWHDDTPDVAGGLIVGETGNGIEITGAGGAVGDVTIDNSNTRNDAGNDLSAYAIDPAVGYDDYQTGPQDTLLDRLTSYDSDSEDYTYNLNYVLSGDYAPEAPDGGITTGIWGGYSGIYMQNIAGKVSVDNAHGQIFGALGDGIQLWDVGSGVTGDLSQVVVDIDNHRGLIEGGTNGADLQGIQNGSLFYDNGDGTTLGGTNGIFVGLSDNVEDSLSVAGNVTVQNEDGLIAGATGDGISIDKVGGSVSISNDKGWGWHGDGGTIAGGTNGIVASNIGGVFSLDNERGLTVGYNGDGVNVSNVAGAGLGDYDAVYVDNTDGGLIAGHGNGIVISSVTGDSEDGVGDANNIYIDNSAQISDCDTVPGGLIVGVTGNGISVTNVASEGEGSVSGSLTIDNQNTWSTTIDLADYGSGIYDYNYDCPPESTGLLLAADYGWGEDGEQTTGIFGATNGVYGSNIGGDVNVYNEDGLIVGTTAEGVNLATIGGNVFIANEDNGNGGGWIGGSDGGILGTSVTGNFTVLNSGGTVAGFEGDGVHVGTLGGAFYLDNSGGGSTVGYAGAGVWVENVSGNVGDSEITDAVAIDNTDGGLIAGSEYGIIINNVTGDSSTEGVVNSVYIDNSAQPWGCDPTNGGLIVGVNSDGIHITNVVAEGDEAVSGDVTIDNQDTLATTIDLADYGSGIYEYNCEEPTSGLLGSNDYGWGWSGEQTTGIFGGTNGIYASNVGGNVTVYNEDGLIVGDDGDGIQLSDIGGNVEIDNGYTYVETYDGYSGSWFDGQGGVIQGDVNGISLTNITGNVTVNNALGWIEGDNEDGIRIRGDEAAGADNVYVYNGEYDSESGDWVNGGSILGEQSAISIADVTSVVIDNGALWWDWCDNSAWGGLILGGGGEYAAIDLNTSNAVGGGATIVNQGIIAASSDDTFYPWNLAQNYYDSLDIWNAVRSDQQGGSLDNLADYGASAANKAIATSGETNGATQVTNYGLIVGTVNLAGATDDGDDGHYGNTLTNYGAWFTTGANTFSGSGANTIRNEGLIQTAFAQGTWEDDVYTPTLSNTTFTVDDFYNDTPTAYTGVLSSLDGQSGDTITIEGNFHGGTYAAEHPESEDVDAVYSIVALDAYLDAPGGNPSADKLIVTGNVAEDTTTALIINNTNPNALNAGDMNNDGIQVVQVDGSSGGCVDTACVDGDTFYISSASHDYIEYNGVGMIQQGSFYAWYLTERDEGGSGEGGEGYYLVTEALPDSYQAPAVTTGFVNIFYAGTDLVSDHLYGGHFPEIGSGGGGDDVTPQGPDQSKKNTGVWARVSGSWSSQNSSVNTGVGTYDTSFNQNTYTLLGGVDMSPNGGGSGFRFGAYGGYVQSDMSFTSYGTTGKYTGGEVGAYAAYTQGGFYVDAQVDADFLNVNYDATLGGTPVNADTDGTSLGVVANIGNRFYKGASFFEPLASVSYANMTLGDIQSGGATVSFSDGESLRGGIGGRIGTAVKSANGWLTEFSVLGRLWNEFAGSNTVTITDGSNTNTFTNDIGGLYEEVEGTVTFADTKTDLSTYVSGGAMFGSDSITWNAKAGVRKEF